MRKLPPLVELRAFEAAARCRSFKLAATELGVTPTAVSHQIKLLEAYCGQPLFRRQPRPITLTWAGEQLFPVVRDGFTSFAEAINVVRAGGATGRLRITTTNAFAARWLVPRLPQWRKAHARLKLEIVASDEVLSLKNGEADISIRYVRSIPTDGLSFELTRDRFHVVAAPKLVGKRKRPFSPAELARFPLIEAGWRSNDAEAPTWQQWEAAARKHHKHVPDLSGLVSLNFREELHAIEAAISGQGIAICSDVLVAPELATGALVRLTDVTMPGCRFYIVHRASHPKMSSIKAFVAWAMSAR
ncbi:LysR family transcriptional regulator [Bradyrhizobium jicamae]|uniref:LysR substrate-binding domain-containing protein n=1 Tax=Bradyrhizobium jicamae TaxID=280332 RepID=UPI001BA676B9|nr:LysR substrate-binding domain-containing protein [Bradyrhizobium jicamae]MBR0754081.1 LysR family transcriptional regulator [Bradyrhizobium jicamae]